MRVLHISARDEGADGKVRLVADVRGEDGKPRAGSPLELTPEEPRS